MKRKYTSMLVALLAAGIVAETAHAGRIVLANDEWTFSSTGYSDPMNDPGQFAQNVASWFLNGGTGGNFLAYSSNFGLTGSQLATSVTSAGHSWTVSTAVAFDLATLSNYDGIFLASNPADNQVLINYVNNGGNVYLAGGTGWGGSVAEANQWNTFLNSFGLGFGTTYNGVGGNIAINNPHPIFTNVDHLYQNNGNDALDILISDPQNQILTSQNGHGLYAVYDPASAVPEPASMLLFGAGMAGLIGSRIRKKKQ